MSRDVSDHSDNIVYHQPDPSFFNGTRCIKSMPCKFLISISLLLRSPPFCTLSCVSKSFAILPFLEAETKIEI